MTVVKAMKNSQNQLEHKGIAGSVEWSDEDGVHYGHLKVPQDLVMYEGVTPEKLQLDFIDAVEVYIQDVQDMWQSLQESEDFQEQERLASELRSCGEEMQLLTELAQGVHVHESTTHWPEIAEAMNAVFGNSRESCECRCAYILTRSEGSSAGV